MNIAYILFNDSTLLDFIGVYDPVSRLKNLGYIPDLEWNICSYTDTVQDSFGLEIKPTKCKNDLSEYDVIIVPGGIGTRALLSNEEFIRWIQTAQNVQYKISVCTGSLILGAAGFLRDKKATTHFQEYEVLKNYCREVSTDRIVEDGDIITAGAVASSIDLGLYLCAKWAGIDAKNEIRKKMDYHG